MRSLPHISGFYTHLGHLGAAECPTRTFHDFASNANSLSSASVPSVARLALRCLLANPRRSHRPKPAFRKVILDGDRRSDGRYLEISATSCPEGATLDWGWPPTYGSGPFALATPCTHVPGRYSEPSKFKSRVAHPWSWDIGSSTSAAWTSLNMVLAVGKPGLSASARNWGFRKAVDHFRRERRCGQSLVRWTEEPQAVRLLKGASDVKRAVRLAQRVTSSIRSRGGTRANEHGESSRRERLGCPAHP